MVLPSGDQAGWRSPNSVPGHLLEHVVAEIVDEEIRDAAGQAAERDVAAVRREGRAEDLGQLPERDLPVDLAALRFDDGQPGPATGDAAEDELFPRRVPGSGRLDELDALEVGIDRGRDDLLPDLARVGVGEKEIDREQVPRREEDDGLPVGTDGRGDVIRIGLGALEQGPGELVRRLGLLQDRRVGVLHRLVPVGRELLQLDAQDCSRG